MTGLLPPCQEAYVPTPCECSIRSGSFLCVLEQNYVCGCVLPAVVQATVSHYLLVSFLSLHRSPSVPIIQDCPQVPQPLLVSPAQSTSAASNAAQRYVAQLGLVTALPYLPHVMPNWCVKCNDSDPRRGSICCWCFL